jgi:hypothetical protein
MCNGHPELCDRKYGNTTFFGSHDSFAFSKNPLALARTQEVDIEMQLNLGVRLLQVQAHMHNEEIRLCHTSCALYDGGTAESYLRTVKTFLDANPHEVMTIIIANKWEGPAMSAWRAVFDNSGMASLAYVPGQPFMSRNNWPTLGDMISTGKRVVVFMDKGFGHPEEASADFILPEFEMVWEDSIDPDNINFPCAVERTARPQSFKQQLNLINHNLNANVLPIGWGVRFPDRLNSPRTNGVSLVMKHAETCASLMDDQRPNFVLLDYVNIGHGAAAVDRLNGF